VQLARNALRDAIAASPLAGVVAKRHVQAGEKVAFDSPLVTVVDLSDMELQAAVPAVDVPELAIGKSVELTIDGFGERRFTGRVERINPAAEPGTRAILVYVGIPNADRALRGGMFATGRIALAASAPVPTLPATAVRSEAGQTFVWTVEGGKLVKRFVTTGRRDDAVGRVELKTTLPPDAPVLAARFDNLRDGAPAVVKAPAPAPVPASAPRRRRRRPDAGGRLTLKARERDHVDHTSLHQQPGLRHDGDDRHRRSRALRLQPASRSSRCPTSACRFVLVLTGVSGANPESSRPT
jgi:pyruvate/2-oxoglutarate dehydrogenase complex dihydrolipoamide acyltransferase (E2) component